MEDFGIKDKNGVEINPCLGTICRSGTGSVYRVTGVWFKASERVRIEMVDQSTGKKEVGSWDGFVRMVGEGELVWV